MIGPGRLASVTAEAAVPEQVVAYVCAVAGSRPRMIAGCVGYTSESGLVLVGYPLQDPLDADQMTAAVDEALALPGLARITVIGPARPPQAPATTPVIRDGYYALPLPAPPPGQKLRNLLRRARREVDISHGRTLGDDHMALVQDYLDNRRLASGTRRIFRRLPRYVETSTGSLIVSARRGDGRLAAFAVGEFASFATAFFMFCFRDPGVAPPGSADLVLSALLEQALQRGHTRMNLGLEINAGVSFFKRKWGAERFLPYVEASWELKPSKRGLISTIRRLAGKRPYED